MERLDSRKQVKTFRPARAVLVLVVVFVVVIALQAITKGYTAEFSGYPDEASHYISGLLVHDYIKAGFPGHPLQFAQNFYLHYPYLAIGHWPPLFYAIEGSWMVLFSPSRFSVMILMAVLTSVLAISVFLTVSRDFGEPTARIATLLLICAPLVLQYTSMVMLEVLLAALSFWAVVFFGRFVQNGKTQDSSTFAIFAILAILTKANGFELVLVPPVVLVICRRFDVLKRLNFWMPVAAIAAVTLPWHFATLHLMLPTFTAEAGWRFTSRALLFYSRATVASVGMGVAGLAVIGVWDRVITPALKAEVEPGWVALGALPVSVILFHSLVSGGLEKRYLITAIPPILLFCTAGAAAVGNWFAAFLGKPRYMQQIVMASVALLFCLTTLSFPAKGSYGFQGAAEQILSDEGSRGAILVSSETNYGEGILVSEIAMRDRGMKHIVLRASKVLAQNSWNQSLDEDYRPVFGDSTTMQNCLQDAQVRALVIDTTPGPKKYTHHRQLLEAVARHQDEWTLVGSSGSVLLYRSAIPIPFGGDPMRRIRTNLDGGLKSWPIVERFACPGQEVTPTVASK